MSTEKASGEAVARMGHTPVDMLSTAAAFRRYGKELLGAGNSELLIEVRIVDKLPAPALCFPSRRMVFVKSNLVRGEVPIEVGTGQSILANPVLYGAFAHEVGHLLMGDASKWERAIKNTTIPADARGEVLRIMRVLDEPRVEYRVGMSRGYGMPGVAPDVLAAASVTMSAKRLVLADLDVEGLKSDRATWSRMLGLLLGRSAVGVLSSGEPLMQAISARLGDVFSDGEAAEFRLRQAALKFAGAGQDGLDPDHRPVSDSVTASYQAFEWKQVFDDLWVGSDEEPEPEPGGEEPCDDGDEGEAGESGDDGEGEPGESAEPGGEPGEGESAEPGDEPGDEAEKPEPTKAGRGPAKDALDDIMDKLREEAGKEDARLGGEGTDKIEEVMKVEAQSSAHINQVRASKRRSADMAWRNGNRFNARKGR